jgi:hypothetical protein
MSVQGPQQAEAAPRGTPPPAVGAVKVSVSAAAQAMVGARKSTKTG